MPKASRPPKDARKADGSPAKAPSTRKRGAKWTNVLPNILVIRGHPAYREWARRLAEHAKDRGFPALVESALLVYAQAKGFPEMPPDRLKAE